MVKIKWTIKKSMRDLEKHIRMTMTKIVIFLEQKAKQLVSRGNLTGEFPSRPGEPPKVRTGTLRANITYDVIKSRGEIVGLLGVKKGLADSYASRLEDKGIRDGTTRPFLRPTVLSNRVKILKMLR
jgi:hypothetical protein